MTRTAIDVARADAEIDSFIERRADARHDDDELHPMYQESVKRRAAQLRAEAHAEWRRFHTNMSRLHRKLAEEHDEKARRLEQ